MDTPIRCGWPTGHEDYLAYHDHEWGRPTTNADRLFEKICLEGFQSGLSWLTILRKRDRFREVFSGFDIDTVAAYTEADVERLLDDPGIIRHRGKIEATINNARRARELIDEEGSLVDWIWSWAVPEPERTPGETEEVGADTGVVGQQLFAGEATRLAYGTDEAREGRDAFVEKRDKDFSRFPWHY